MDSGTGVYDSEFFTEKFCICNVTCKINNDQVAVQTRFYLASVLPLRFPQDILAKTQIQFFLHYCNNSYVLPFRITLFDNKINTRWQYNTWYDILAYIHIEHGTLQHKKQNNDKIHIYEYMKTKYWQSLAHYVEQNLIITVHTDKYDTVFLKGQVVWVGFSPNNLGF